ncbi:MAG: HTH-type transcriptional regulator cbl [Verrucomicrobia subdivision 3 bacterium]|nr:HTH-type transcriptional regulator cbl [Limisphaerales bacterium]MCS1414624.1 HTH-type transcriptional regulator cbl [Limisphaerales bacterium]
MNIHHLELFYYVAKHGGIMEAVRNMPYGIQQPAVSGQIIQLEADLGVKLFQRRPFALTAEGERLAAFINPFFDEVDTVCNQIRDGSSELLRIGAPPLVLDRYFPEIIREIQVSLPSVKLLLKQGHHREIHHLIKTNAIDLAITPIEDLEQEEDQTVHLIDINLCLLVPKASPIKSCDYFWRQDRIAEPLISLPADEFLAKRFQLYLVEQKLSWPPMIELSSMDLIERYVAAGLGIGLGIGNVPTGSTTSIRRIALNDIKSIRVGVLWRNDLSPVGKRIIELCRKQAALLAKTENHKMS